MTFDLPGGRRHVPGYVGVETEDEGRPAAGGSHGPDLRTAGHLQDTSKAKALVADALVGVLRALRELADPIEVFLAKRLPAIADRQHGFGICAQHERDSPCVVGIGVRERIVCVLQQLENAPAPVLLGDLGVEAGDGAIVARAVLEFIEERLDLTLGLSDDEFVSDLPRRRTVGAHVRDVSPMHCSIRTCSRDQRLVVELGAVRRQPQDGLISRRCKCLATASALVVLYSPGAEEGSTTRSMVKRRWSSFPRATSTASRRASNRSMLERMSRRSARRSSTRVFTPAIWAESKPATTNPVPTIVPMIAFVSELTPVA